MTAFTRRQLLGIPALLPVVAAASKARASNGGNFIFFHTPNGFHRSAFGADGSGTAFKLRPSLAPLEAWRSELSVVQGLCNPSTDAVVGFSQACRLLTCTGGPDKQSAYSASLDQAVARTRGAQALNLFALAESPHPPVCPISWKAAGLPAENLQDNEAVWNELFDSVSVKRGSRERQALLHEFLNPAFTRNYALLPEADKERMNTHMAALAELAKRQAAECALTPPFGLEVAAALPRTFNGQNLQKNGRAKIDMMVAAMACGAWPCATFAWQAPGPAAMNPLSNVANHFELSQKADAASVTERTRIDAWYASQFAYLIEQLAKQNVLDHTIVVWGSEVAEGQHHNNMTFVLAGGKGLGMRRQVTVALPFSGDETAGRATALRPGNRPVADLWLTILRCLGMPQAAFGDAPATPLSALTT